MARDLNVPAARLRDMARTLKRGFDDLQETDSGWYYVDFDHPAFGRDPAESTARRIPGNVIAATEEPGAEADALIVAAGYEDSFTGDVHLGNGLVLSGPTQGRATYSQPAGEGPDRRLPAVALFAEGGRAHALIGTLHETREEATFDTLDLSPQVEEALAEWLDAAARGEPSGYLR
jgi:hypothetical protein